MDLIPTMYGLGRLSYNRPMGGDISEGAATSATGQETVRRTTLQRGYVPQLDALRFFAILGVLVTHEWQVGPYPWIFAGIAWGSVGVRLFFVLSGFLITGILLDCRRREGQFGARRSVLIRRFYIRRFLRIFPLYYGVLAVLIFAGISAEARHLWPWLFSYTTNIYIWHSQQWIGPIGIFWTLAVEEQFYLIWPFLVFFVPRRWLVPVLLGLISLAPLFRLWASIHEPGDLNWNGYTSGVFTVAVFDSLGVGALLAILLHRDATGGVRVQRLLNRVALPVGAGALLAVLALSYYLGVGLRFVLGETALALVLAWLVGSANRGFSGTAGRVLEWRPITYFGKVSYGIYIMHPFVPIGFAWLAHRLGTEYDVPRLVNFVLVTVVTAGLAALSWHLFERPINGLKRFFPYRDTPPPRARPAAPQVAAATSQVRSVE